MYLGREAHDFFQRLKEPEMEKRTAETMKSLAVTTIRSIRQPVATLSGGQRQSVAVARAVMWNSRLVILDEPTAALGVAQTEQVLELVARLAEQGLAVVLISHNLHDIFAVAHRITVLRLGRNIALYEREKTTQQEVVGAITAGVPTKVSGIAIDRCRRRHHEQRRRHDIRRRPETTGVVERIRGNISAGNLGSWPVADRARPDHRLLLVQGRRTSSRRRNFTNIITQMAGVTMLAYGVVFVLLIGEIDLSISYVSGVAGVVVAQLTIVAVARRRCPAGSRSSSRSPRAPLIGAFQGSIVALVGVPAFVVTLAGYQIWQGVIQKSIPQGVIVIQDNTVNDVANYFFSKRAGWIMALIVAGHLPRRTLAGVHRSAGGTGSPSETRGCSRLKTVGVLIATFGVVAICNKDRGVPFVCS